MNYFQEPGRVEAEAEADVRRWLESFYYGASADAPSGSDADMWIIPKGDRAVDRMPRLDTPVAWLPREDLDVHAGEFERSGLRGGFNRYRNLDRDSDDLAALRGQPLRIPTLFIGGDKDGPTAWGPAPSRDSPRRCRSSRAVTSSAIDCHRPSRCARGAGGSRLAGLHSRLVIVSCSSSARERRAHRTISRRSARTSGWPGRGLAARISSICVSSCRVADVRPARSADEHGVAQPDQRVQSAHLEHSSVSLRGRRLVAAGSGCGRHRARTRVSDGRPTGQYRLFRVNPRVFAPDHGSR